MPWRGGGTSTNSDDEDSKSSKWSKKMSEYAKRKRDPEDESALQSDINWDSSDVGSDIDMGEQLYARTAPSEELLQWQEDHEEPPPGLPACFYISSAESNVALCLEQTEDWSCAGQFAWGSDVTVAPWLPVEVELFKGVPVGDAAVAKAEAERMRAHDMGSTESYLDVRFFGRGEGAQPGSTNVDIRRAVARADAAGCVVVETQSLVMLKWALMNVPGATLHRIPLSPTEIRVLEETPQRIGWGCWIGSRVWDGALMLVYDLNTAHILRGKLLVQGIETVLVQISLRHKDIQAIGDNGGRTDIGPELAWEIARYMLEAVAWMQCNIGKIDLL
ncbi:hypothetical protein B0H13DRAFT_1917476 [Mycena leptocephala]|nr:hypothetical protein B0H13DRAFT_1917476 [Mycena leptocephala]